MMGTHLFLKTFFFLYVVRYSTTYYIGTGIGDITGPAAEINMMGMANPAQITAGIHIRIYSRAYIIMDDSKNSRVVFVNTDMAMIPQIVKTKVSRELKKLYGGIYDETNVLLTATHTHSGPGGYHQYLLFDITSFGFVEESFNASVDGILKSIQMAHDNLQPGKIFINEGDLFHSNINRSPTSYLVNPAEERAKYKNDTDTLMTVMRFQSNANKELGMVSFFAVHGTSMNNTNVLISGDNKGYASQLFERLKNPHSLLGNGSFVAAFTQSNEGDVSPNVFGPHCSDSGLPCDNLHSQCHGKTALCYATGPGKDMFESTKMIGYRQYVKAKELYDSARTELKGAINHIHQFVDMTNQTVTLANGTKSKTCKPAMGYSFAAGTTDGPGAFNFKQGTKTDNKFWNLVRNFLHKPSKEQIACQHPKPILLDTGEIKLPFAWQPEIVETQIIQVGQLYIIAVPGEFTTMSGRRLREAVRKAVTKADPTSKPTVVIAGLANTYSDYISTYEEYQAQRYEAASTIYGPHTLQAYIQQYAAMAYAMAKGTKLPAGPRAPYFVEKLFTFVPGVVFDAAGIGKHFGDVVKQANATYKQGSQVEVIFVSAHPRNNLRLGGTFLTVDYFNTSRNAWQTVLTDSYWDTKFHWYRPGKLASLEGRSEARITWDIDPDQKPGRYRIRHFGTSKSLFGKKTQFVGESRAFQVLSTRLSWADTNQG